jgi:hypothetical protein
VLQRYTNVGNRTLATPFVFATRRIDGRIAEDARAQIAE